MKKVIDRKRYDTETAEWICDISPNYNSSGDFRYEVTDLYRTKKGAWFIAGEGGPLSRWARNTGNGYSGGAGLRVIDPDHARELLERHGDADDVAKYFVVEDA